MDEDIQKSIRNLGYGFHAGQFSTRSLLETLNITKVYVVSGIIEGVFFRPEELSACVAHYMEDAHLTKEHQKKVEAWIVAGKHERLAIGARHRWGWADGDYLEIAVIDLNTQQLCADSKSATQLTDVIPKHNSSCEAIPCGHDLMGCSMCAQELCFDCIAGGVDGHNNWINPDDEAMSTEFNPVCQKCYDKLPKQEQGANDGRV